MIDREFGGTSDIPMLVSSYEVLLVSSALIFTFSVTLASENRDTSTFNYDTTMYSFNILVSLCISCSLYTTLIMSAVVFTAKRLLGYKYISRAQDYISNTRTPRRIARYCFVASLIFFLLCLCVLFADASQPDVVVINCSILVFGMAAVIHHMCNYDGNH